MHGAEGQGLRAWARGVGRAQHSEDSETAGWRLVLGEETFC